MKIQDAEALIRLRRGVSCLCYLWMAPRVGLGLFWRLNLALHVVGAKCPCCGKKGLVAGALAAGLSNLTGFRPAEWRLDALPVQGAVCPHCGVVTTALPGKALKRLRELLKTERLNETVAYHSIKPKRGSKPDGRDGNDKTVWKK